MGLTERGLYSGTTIDEKGRRVLGTALVDTGLYVVGLGGGGGGFDLAGAIAAQSSLASAMRMALGLSGATAGAATFTGTRPDVLTGFLGSNVAAQSAFGGTAIRLHLGVSGRIPAVAEFASTLLLYSPEIGLQGTVSGISGFSATITTPPELVGAVASASSLGGVISLNLTLSGQQSAVAAFLGALRTKGVSSRLVWSVRGEGVGWESDGEWYDPAPGGTTTSNADEGEVLN